MPNHLREKPTLSIWLQICGWLGMIGILFAPQIGVLLYLEHREPYVNQAELTGLELVYNISIKNFLFPDAFATLLVLFIGYKGLTWLERALDQPPKGDKPKAKRQPADPGQGPTSATNGYDR